MANTPQDRWRAANMKRYAIDVAKKTEGDIIAQIEKQTNKAGYIKALIRADIEREAKATDNTL